MTGLSTQHLAGRRVLVAGSSGALGTGLVEAFVGAGAAVLGVDRAMPGDDRRVDGVHYRSLDLLADSEVGALFDSEPAPWAVVNAVGGFAGQVPLAELDVAELTAQLELNLLTAALLSKHALRRMAPVGEGRLIHTASRAALVPAGSGFAYSVSKLAVIHLVTMAAQEVHGTGITVNCVVPSIMDTPANRAAMPAARHESWPKVADVAQVFLFLAAPAAHLVSGAAVPVYGLV